MGVLEDYLQTSIFATDFEICLPPLARFVGPRRKTDADFLFENDLTHDPRAILSRGKHTFSKGTNMSKTGTVKFFNGDKGYGFIQPDDGSADSFVHITAVQAAGMQTLDKEQRLNYEVETGRNGKESAVNLSAAD